MDIIEIFKLFGSIFVDTDEANRSIGKTGKEADGLVKKLGRGIKSAGKWAAALTTAAAGVATAAFAMTKKVVNSFDDIAKSSTKLGVSTDAYQEMEYWAGQNGLSAGSMERAIGRLNQRIGMAADGNDKYAKALENLGVSYKDVEAGTVSTEDAMATVIKTLSEMESSSEKSAKAADLFGTRMARDLMPALQDGSLSLEDAKEKAHELGIVIEEDTLNAAEDFNDTWDDLTRTFGVFSQKIFAELMPAFHNMMEWIMEHMPQIQAVFSFAFDVISLGVSTVIEWIGALISWLSEWYQNNEETLTMIWETIQDVFTSVMEFLQESWEFIKDLWDEYGADIVETITDAFDAIWGIVEKVMPIILDIFEVTFETIKAVVEDIINIIIGIIDTFTAILTGDFSGLKDGLLRIWNSLWSGIKNVVSGAWGILKSAFGGLLTNITNWFTSLPGKALGWGKSFMNGFKNGIKSVAKAIVRVVKAPFNGIIGLVNGLIGALNKVSIKLPKIPKWVPGIGGRGGNTIGFNIPKIPSLATGGVVHDPTLAMIGDAGVGNPEIVAPQKMLKEMFAEALEKQSSQGSNIDTNEIIKLLIELIQAVKDGKNIIVDNKLLGEVTDDEQGKRINMTDRRVAY